MSTATATAVSGRMVRGCTSGSSPTALCHHHLPLLSGSADRKPCSIIQPSLANLLLMVTCYRGTYVRMYVHRTDSHKCTQRVAGLHKYVIKPANTCTVVRSYWQAYEQTRMCIDIDTQTHTQVCTHKHPHTPHTPHPHTPHLRHTPHPPHTTSLTHSTPPTHSTHTPLTGSS